MPILSFAELGRRSRQGTGKTLVRYRACTGPRHEGETSPPRTLHHSYWFLPAVMAVMAMMLAGAMLLVDVQLGSAWIDRIPGLYAAHPAGSRLVLSAIGGSMITVAGTVFSVTIAAVVYASGQYGPRLLSNFMSDRGNQVTLGRSSRRISTAC